MHNIFIAIRRRSLAALLRMLLAAPAVFLVAPAVLLAAPAWAQTKHNVEGTPLDTLANSHLTADVPEAKDFVKSARPDAKALDYTPLTGSESARPKPRDPSGVKALQAELESAGVKNAQRAKGLLPAKRADTGKGKPAKAGE
ncbi:MAG: hypothetical protein ABSA13_12865 [Beijerinckiaceae bacterium]|jgi:hypothetical protein